MTRRESKGEGEENGERGKWRNGGRIREEGKEYRRRARKTQSLKGAGVEAAQAVPVGLSRSLL